MRSDIRPGAHFPDDELPDHTNAPCRLSELQGENPMILTLARDHYCPKEMQQHLDLAAFWPKIRVAYTAIVTITMEDLLAFNELRMAIGACWPFLSDRERVLQQDLQIEEYTETHYDRPLIPHTLILEPDLRIYKIYNGIGFGADRQRATCGTTFPKEIVYATGLCEISGAIGLMTCRRQRLAAIMLVVYLICETPANVKMAVEGLSVQGMPTARWFYSIRLLLIPVAIWWALYCGGVMVSARDPGCRSNL